MTTSILYLAHDLGDAAVRRRVMMLVAGGAKVSVAGFQRAENLLEGFAGVEVIVLGRTSDARFGQRLMAVARSAMSLGKRLSGLRRPDVILARNLEMLTLARRAATMFGNIPIAYECLDIHRLLLDKGVKGRLLRLAEGIFGRKARLLVTSSPAFVENYFEPLSRLSLPVLLLENKVLDLEGLPPPVPLPVHAPAAHAPWRIGWFGALRCRRSLAILSDFARRMDGRVEIVLRGRPAHGEFADFHREVAEAPHVRFLGPYRNPEDLAAIYSGIHFAWAIDFFEQGLNSEWLLPNRLYEGPLHGAVPIALASTETGRFLDRRGIGLTMAEASVTMLVRQFEEMDAGRYEEMRVKLDAHDPSAWTAGPDECRALVSRLAALAQPLNSDKPLPAVSFARSS